MRNAAITMTHKDGHVTNEKEGKDLKNIYIRDIMCGVVDWCQYFGHLPVCIPDYLEDGGRKVLRYGGTRFPVYMASYSSADSKTNVKASRANGPPYPTAVYSNHSTIYLT